ncbi:MAG: cysteine desulfurase family protein [Bacillota bacterium]|nr:cysteine desulfurase family protein [Bacillota bacterium]
MIYLDNSATTKQYDEVTAAMITNMEEVFGNPSSLYQLGVDSEKAIKRARKQVLECAGLSDYEVVFTSGGTEADNMAIFGAAKILSRSGNRIVTTAVEHPAVLECFKELEREGFDVVRVGVDRSCRLNMDELEAAIDSNTILVSIMHINNEIGTIMPINSVREIMNKKKAPGLLHCDAVQSFGKMPLPGSADLISVSGHKIHGPKGSGALLIGRDRKNPRKNINIPAYILGGGQELGKRSGTENVPAIVGLGVAASIAADDGGNNYATIEKLWELRERLRVGLEDRLEDIVINSPDDPEECCPTVLNISFSKTRGEVILHTLEQSKIYVSTGSACSSNKKGQSHVLAEMGLNGKEIEGTLRFSLGRMNKEEEIDIAIEKVVEAVERFRRLGSFR